MYPAKLSFIIEGEMKTCHDGKTLKEFMTTKQALQKIPNTGEENKHNCENEGKTKSH
jgi:hypothetical protein